MIVIRFLLGLNAAYDKCNWNVKIMTQTAVSNHEGTANFYSDNAFENLEWGGTIIGKKNINYHN